MDEKRAREIIESPYMVNVTHNGTRIYIESVNEDQRTAYIHPVDQPKAKQEVPLAYLLEE